jgi:dTDP-glucose 4,6-dehydratase
MIILVTGGCGFIGSNFINQILQKNKGVRIINIDKLDYCSNKENVIPNEKYIFINGNINDKSLVLELLNKYEIEYVVHFAAQTHVDNSFENSLDYTIDNILGTHTLLECCRIYNKIKRFIHISTDEVYGEISLEHSGCCEKSILNPTNPYAATKAGAEFIVRSYYHSFKLPIIIIRANNVYGINQYPEKLIPKFIMLLKNDKKLTIQGDGKTRRNFIYVNDVVNAIILVMEKGEINEIYNIGSVNEYNVLEIGTILLHLIKGYDKKIDDHIEYIEDRNFNDFRYAIDCTLLKNLGWKEEMDFYEGLRITISWYMKNNKCI